MLSLPCITKFLYFSLQSCTSLYINLIHTAVECVNRSQEPISVTKLWGGAVPSLSQWLLNSYTLSRIVMYLTFTFLLFIIRHSYHTSSFSHFGVRRISPSIYFCHNSLSTHLGARRLRPIIYLFHTRSFSHLAVSRLHPSMPTNHPVLPLLSGPDYYCMPIYPLTPPSSSFPRGSARVAQSH